MESTEYAITNSDGEELITYPTKRQAEHVAAMMNKNVPETSERHYSVVTVEVGDAVTFDRYKEAR